MTSYEIMVGALVGLARAAYSEEHRPETYDLFMEGFAADPADSENCHDIAMEAGRQKHVYSPGCATCDHPCGRTADYDLRLLKLDEKDVREAKEALIEEIVNFARSGTEWTENTEKAVYDAVCIIAEEMSAQEIGSYRAALEALQK